MCGIFGSSDYKTYIKLYAKNMGRGAFAYGSIMFDTKIHATVKSAGVFKLTDKMYLSLKNNKKKDFKHKWLKIGFKHREEERNKA